MKNIEKLDLGHTRFGLDKEFIIRIADVHDDKDLETDFPHRHNFYMICLVIKGSGIHVIDFEKIKIKPGRLFFLQPEQVHFWKIDKGSKLAVVQFSEEFLTVQSGYKRLPAIHSVINPFIDLKPNDVDLFLGMLQRIESENLTRQIHSELIIQSGIVIMLADIERLMKPGLPVVQPNSRGMIAEKFKGLVESKFKEVTAIHEYARLLNITPNYLNIVVRETTGLTATEFLHKRVILEARRLLINKNNDIVQVAYELGFKDASYFSRFFRRFTGMSPSSFRKDIYKKYQHQDN